MYPQFKEEDQKTIEQMYAAFQEAGDPLPKDPALIDYSFDYQAF